MQAPIVYNGVGGTAAVRQTYGGRAARHGRSQMARIDPTAVLPDRVPAPGDLELTLADVVVGLLVLTFFLVTLLAVLRRLAVL